MGRCGTIAMSTISFFCPEATSVMLAYLVSCAPELEAVWMATWGVNCLPVSCSFFVTRPVPKYSSISPPSVRSTSAAFTQSIVLPPPKETSTSGEFSTIAWVMRARSSRGALGAAPSTSSTSATPAAVSAARIVARYASPPGKVLRTSNARLPCAATISPTWGSAPMP